MIGGIGRGKIARKYPACPYFVRVAFGLPQRQIIVTNLQTKEKSVNHDNCPPAYRGCAEKDLTWRASGRQCFRRRLPSVQTTYAYAYAYAFPNFAVIRRRATRLLFLKNTLLGKIFLVGEDRPFKNSFKASGYQPQ